MAPPVDPTIITIELAAPKGLYLDDLSAFPYDTALPNDATVLRRPDSDYEFNQFFWRRNGRPTRDEDRVVVKQVRHQSPILAELIAGSGAGLAVFKALEHVWHTKARWRKENTEQAIREADLRNKELDAELKRKQLEQPEDGDGEDGPTLIAVQRGEPPIELPEEAGPVLRRHRLAGALHAHRSPDQAEPT